MSVIHNAFTAGLYLFGFTAVLLKGQRQMSVKSTNDTFMFVVPLLAVVSVIAGHLIFKQLLGNLNNELSLKEKIKGYQSATIIRFALTEFPALFAIVAFMLTRNILFLVIAGLLIVYLRFLKPTKPRTEKDLNLSYEEKLIFDREDEML